MNQISPLKIAVQKSGRLSQESLSFLKACGLSFNFIDNKLCTPVRNFPAEILFLRDDDIPECLCDGVADLGICGENLLIEQKKPVEMLMRLGFSRCRLSIAVPRDEDYHGLSSLNGRSIATSYPESLRQFLEKEDISAEVREIRGCTEIAPNIGIASAICDLVSSGSTLLSNGLKEFATLYQSEALLMRSQELSAEKESLLNTLTFRAESVLRARENKYLLMNAPKDTLEKILSSIPALRSPTVVPLRDENWFSVSSVINTDQCWNVVEELQGLGAEGILVTEIAQMVP